jgi:hypothetical protein
MRKAPILSSKAKERVRKDLQNCVITQAVALYSTTVQWSTHATGNGHAHDSMRVESEQFSGVSKVNLVYSEMPVNRKLMQSRDATFDCGYIMLYIYRTDTRATLKDTRDTGLVRVESFRACRK